MAATDLVNTLAKEAERMEKENDAPRRHVRSLAPKDPSQVYSIRIPVAKLASLRQLAAASGLAPTAMLRGWILERLEAVEDSHSSLLRSPNKGSDTLEVKLQNMGAARDDVKRALLERMVA